MHRKPQDKASKTSRQSKPEKTSSGRFSIKEKWSRLPEDKRIRLMKVTGLLVGVLAVFTFVSVTSYLFTWKSDHSLLSEPDMLGQDVSAHNMGGKLGYRWGRFLVGRCFGLGSYAMVILLAAVSIRLFFRKRDVGLVKTLVETVSGALLVSVILSFISSLSGPDIMFGGGLGGDCGAEISAFSFGCSMRAEGFQDGWLLSVTGRSSRRRLQTGFLPVKLPMDRRMCLKIRCI